MYQIILVNFLFLKESAKHSIKNWHELENLILKTRWVERHIELKKTL